MSKVTGKNSRVNGFPCVGYFEVNVEALDEPVWCSDSDGGAIRVDATQDWNALIRAYGKAPPASNLPGEFVQFQGVDSAGIGWNSGAAGAIVEKVEIFVPAFPARAIRHETTLGGNGAITAGAASGGASVVPTPVSGAGIAVTLDGAAVTGCVESRLALICNTRPYGDSDVSGWMQRAAGHFEARLVYRVNMDGVSNVPAVNTDFAVTVPVGGSDKWECSWMRVLARKAVYDHGAREGRPKMVGMDVVMGWNSVKTGSRGFLKTSAGTAWPST